MITTLTGHNQITIPSALAKKFSLKNGSRLEWKIGHMPDEIVCRILPDPSRLAAELRGAGKNISKKGRAILLRFLRRKGIKRINRNETPP